MAFQCTDSDCPKRTEYISSMSLYYSLFSFFPPMKLTITNSHSYSPGHHNMHHQFPPGYHMPYYPHHPQAGLTYPHAPRHMTYPQGYHPHARSYGHYPPQHNVKKNENKEKDATSTTTTDSSTIGNEKQPEEERVVSEQASGTTLVFKTPTKTNTLPKPPMKAPTKPSSEKESVVDAAAKAEAEKNKAKSKENMQPKDAQVVENNSKEPTASSKGAQNNQQNKQMPMPPPYYYHPGHMPPPHYMMHPYPPPYAMPNLVKRPKKKTSSAAPPALAAQQPAPVIDNEMTSNANASRAPAIDKAKAGTLSITTRAASVNVKQMTIADKPYHPGSGRKNSNTKWCKEEASCLSTH